MGSPSCLGVADSGLIWDPCLGQQLCSTSLVFSGPVQVSSHGDGREARKSVETCKCFSRPLLTSCLLSLAKVRHVAEPRVRTGQNTLLRMAEGVDTRRSEGLGPLMQPLYHGFLPFEFSSNIPRILCLNQEPGVLPPRFVFS